MIEQHLPAGTAVVRAMPNTAASVGRGVTALAGGTHASEEQLSLVRELFSAAGAVLEVPEELLDAVTAVSGSGPAYFFLMAEALARAAEHLGLDAQQARLLARHTLIGAGAQVDASPVSLEEQRRRVTSPNGTTHAGVTVLQDGELDSLILRAATAARDRSRQLGTATPTALSESSPPR
ncbi:MAG: pyrroline-5-carboxylate reductase [Propionicimonas sp.]|nr:pyrroline-5-carboxylate reductase [Propionicimonas sp.]